MPNFKARKFNKESYDKSDVFAKRKFIEFLVKKGHKIVESKEDYSHDIITKKDGVIFYFEVETKRHRPFTNRETYPFQTVSFLGRKRKIHNKHPFYYIIICKETNWAICCDSNKIFIDIYNKKVNINTIHTKGKDQFFRVPKEECLFFNLN